MPSFRLHVLGSPRVTDATGGDTGFPAGKPLALLALVALDPGEITRDDVAAILWPTSSHDRARASVRQALWTLRTKLDQQVVVEADDGSLVVDDGILTTDLVRLQEAVAASDAPAVADLWAGGPFKGFAVPDAPGWNKWASEFHARWEGRVGAFLEDYAAALPVGDRLEWVSHALEVRPYRASLHELRIRTLLELGHLDEARQALREARDRLEDEAELELGALESELHAAVRGRYGGESGDPLTLAFVGRSAEFAALSDVLHAVEKGQARRVTIVGAPGIGKTRLATEFANVARAGGALTVEVRGVAGERKVAHGVTGSLVRQLLGLPGAAGISNASAELLQALVPSRGRGNGAPLSVPPEAALADALTDLLDAVAEESPLMLFLDDLHWADEASRTLLHRAMRFAKGRPILLLETCRTEMGESSVLRELRLDAESGRVDLLPLAPLNQDDVGQLLIQLAAFRSEEDAAEAAVALFRASRGHPLHLVALLRSLVQEGVLEERDGEWLFHIQLLPPALEMPAQLQELLTGRLEAISGEARRVLDELAVRGGGTTLESLRRSTRLTEERFTEAMVELFSADLVGWSGGDRVDFSHDLLRDAVAAEGVSRTAVSGFRRIALGAGAVAVAVAAWAVLVPEASSPWEGTTVEIRFGDEVIDFAPASDGSWVVQETVRIPELDEGLFWPLSGGLDAVGGTLGQWRVADRGPDIARLTPEGSLEIVADGGGDDSPLDLSPDGRLLLFSSDDPQDSIYRLDLELLDLETGAWTTLLEADYSVRAGWASDGRSISVLSVTMDGPDRLLRLRPDGSRMAAVTLPEGYGIALNGCGPDRAAVQLQRPRAISEWIEMDWTTGGWVELPPGIRNARSWTCSPDGAYRAVLDDVRSSEIRLLRADTFEEVGRIAVDGRPVTGAPHWMAEDVRVPVEVRGLAPDSMAWGARVPLGAEVRDARGRLLQLPVEWRELDGRIVSVRDDSLFANRPGQARIVAELDGWLTDTIQVQVSQDATEALLLEEEFTEFPGERWVALGEPEPRRVQVEGEWVLDSSGDAVWSDGIRSLVSHPGSRGLTVEVEFRLPLTDRRDRQSILLCLMDAANPVDTTGLQIMSARLPRYCARYPQGENDRFDPEALALQEVFGLPATELGGEEWNTLGVQIQPDGRLSAIVNGQEVGVYPEPAEAPGDREYSVVVLGRAQDTRLLLRRVTLWSGPRY